MRRSFSVEKCVYNLFLKLKLKQEVIINIPCSAYIDCSQNSRLPLCFPFIFPYFRFSVATAQYKQVRKLLKLS
jgi:hypothetical protein